MNEQTGCWSSDTIERCEVWRSTALRVTQSRWRFVQCETTLEILLQRLFLLRAANQPEGEHMFTLAEQLVRELTGYLRLKTTKGDEIWRRTALRVMYFYWRHVRCETTLKQVAMLERLLVAKAANHLKDDDKGPGHAWRSCAVKRLSKESVCCGESCEPTWSRICFHSRELTSN